MSQYQTVGKGDKKLQKAAINEAKEIIQKWSVCMSKRWKMLRDRMDEFGVKSDVILAIKIRESLVRVIAENNQGGLKGEVMIEFKDGSKMGFADAVMESAFDLSALSEVREKVTEAIDSIEKGFEKKIADLPKLVEEFGADVLDVKLEEGQGVKF